MQATSSDSPAAHPGTANMPFGLRVVVGKFSSTRRIRIIIRRRFLVGSAPTGTFYPSVRSTDRDKRCVIFVHSTGNRRCKAGRQRIPDLVTLINHEIMFVGEGRKCKVLCMSMSITTQKMVVNMILTLIVLGSTTPLLKSCSSSLYPPTKFQLSVPFSNLSHHAPPCPSAASVMTEPSSGFSDPPGPYPRFSIMSRRGFATSQKIAYGLMAINVLPGPRTRRLFSRSNGRTLKWAVQRSTIGLRFLVVRISR